jgi:hypothetical protein
MASGWIFHDSDEWPPERTIAKPLVSPGKRGAKPMEFGDAFGPNAGGVWSGFRFESGGRSEVGS